jgi:predicted AAA+ superfamily ATPase
LHAWKSIEVQEKELNKLLMPQKVTLLLGARRVGKSILIENFLEKYKGSFLLLNGEDEDTHELLAKRTTANYKRLLNGYDLLVIDEAQAIPEIGKKLKLIVDTIKGVKVLVTGSSAFDLLNVSGEPLTGRSNTLNLYPIWQGELKENLLQAKQNLDERLIYGSYPELWHYEKLEDKKRYLVELVNAYLLKDILILDGIRSPSVIFNLLKMIAYQIGKKCLTTNLAPLLELAKTQLKNISIF